MVDRKVSGFTVDVEGKPFVYIHGDRISDPHAYWAQQKLLGDFDRLALPRKALEGLVAYAETHSTFEFSGEDVWVCIEGDPGVITITSARRDLIDSLLERLQEIGGYDIERRI